MQSRYKWFVVGVFFAFMLLHQADKLLIGNLAPSIMEEFNLNEEEMGRVFTSALVVGAIFYPLWGFLYDRYGRARLLALASLIWGVTTWFGAIAPTYQTFVAARGSTGVDDASYPGIFSLISDYFGPDVRGKIYGLLQLTAPVGNLIALILALTLGGLIGWRNIFYFTGALGIVLAVAIFFGVKEIPRGKAEPELAGIDQVAIHKFDLRAVSSLLRKPTMIPLFIQGFFGVFPLNVISSWFITYLTNERGYSDEQILPIMGIATVTMAIGAFIGGWLGDYLFKRTVRGRLIVSAVSVFLAALFMFIAINIPSENPLLFGAVLALTAFFVLFSGPNVISTVYDITVPEVRSSALAVQYFIESIGSASAPYLVGVLALRSNLTSAILLVCISTYIVCGVFLIIATYFVPRDIKILREQMRERAVESQALVDNLKPSAATTEIGNSHLL